MIPVLSADSSVLPASCFPTGDSLTRNDRRAEVYQWTVLGGLPRFLGRRIGELLGEIRLRRGVEVEVNGSAT
jgi:hypothetical protein